MTSSSLTYSTSNTSSSSTSTITSTTPKDDNHNNPFATATKTTTSRRPSYRRRTVQGRRRHHGSTTSGVKTNPTTNNTIVVPLPLPPTDTVLLRNDWILSNVTTVLVHYVLYSRGLWPLTVPQLSQELNKTTTPSPSLPLPPPSLRRKLRQAHQRLDAWTAAWDSITPLLPHCPYILLSLGPSFARTRESYLLDATMYTSNTTTTTATGTDPSSSAATPTASAAPPTPRPNLHHALARRLLPKLIEADVELPSRAAPSYQLWVSVFLLDSSSSSTSSATTTQASAQQHPATTTTNHNHDPDANHDLWIRRPGFVLPSGSTTASTTTSTTRRTATAPRLVTIPLLFQQQQQQPTQPQTHPPNDNHNNNDQTPLAPPSPQRSLLDQASAVSSAGHWMTLRTSIKGFRM
jgi:hypothetical protein